MADTFDGRGVTKPTSGGGGIVKTKNYIGIWERFRLVHLPAHGSNVIAIGSRSFNNVFLQMDGSGIPFRQPSGGGVVNCQYGICTWERFEIG